MYMYCRALVGGSSAQKPVCTFMTDAVVWRDETTSTLENVWNSWVHSGGVKLQAQPKCDPLARALGRQDDGRVSFLGGQLGQLKVPHPPVDVNSNPKSGAPRRNPDSIVDRPLPSGDYLCTVPMLLVVRVEGVDLPRAKFNRERKIEFLRRVRTMPRLHRAWPATPKHNMGNKCGQNMIAGLGNLSIRARSTTKSPM